MAVTVTDELRKGWGGGGEGARKDEERDRTLISMSLRTTGFPDNAAFIHEEIRADNHILPSL